MIGEKTRTIIIAVVTIVWAVNFAAGLFVDQYTPAENVNVVFMSIVGGLFAVSARRKNGDDQDHSESDKVDQHSKGDR